MNIHIYKSRLQKQASLTITGSKSESNRVLLLQALYPQIKIENLSNSDDTVLMRKALQASISNSASFSIDIHHAGTAMRFLSAYFSIQPDRQVVLTGSSRMKERPIKILVDALRTLGADIEYLENEGFPPLKIKGKNLIKSKVALKANVSSQYISALLLIASKFPNGLEVTLHGQITSIPYIKMTLGLLNQIGIETSFQSNVIKVYPNTNQVLPKTVVVESDWSSASYYYSLIALSDVDTELNLKAYKEDSLQGDAVLVTIYELLGVKTTFSANTITLQKTERVNQLSKIELDLTNAPDIAQTIAVTAYGLGLECYLIGLHTLKIKETDRLVALKTELEKFGAQISITANNLHLMPSKNIKEDITVETYNDHRMAMAFAPLGLKTSLKIQNADVVSKSYPDFWKDLEHIGMTLK